MRKVPLFLSIISLLLIGAASFAQAAPNRNNKVTFCTSNIGTDFDHTYKVWNEFLNKNVVIKGKGSQVKYNDILTDATLLQKYLDMACSVTKEQYNNWNEEKKIAFLINSYNAYTIALIVNNYPLKSIKDLGSLFSSAWKIKFFTFLGEESSLDKIEQDILRRDFVEPRIHFALVCASKGCPPLRNEAFIPEKLNQQLDDAALNFLSDVSKNYLSENDNTIKISSIFKWYGTDFNTKYGSAKSFVIERISKTLPKDILDKYKVEFLPYDWSLNDIQ